MKTIIDKSTSSKLVSTGSLIDEMHCLSLVAEGMVVVKLKATSIVNAMICLISSYYAFNADYLKGATGHSKNVFIFLEHILLSGVCERTVEYRMTVHIHIHTYTYIYIYIYIIYI